MRPHRLQFLARHRAPAALWLALLALLAAFLLPAVHPHNDLEPCTHHAQEHACNDPDHDDDTPAPVPAHDEHSCDLCQLIAVTSVGLAPILNIPHCTLLSESLAPPAIQPQCPTAQTLPPAIPARGPPTL